MGLKTLLAIPPDYDHNFPPLGTPALSAYLKNKGLSCLQVDLNMEYKDFLAQRISGNSPLTLKEQKDFLQPTLQKFFSERLKDRYYSTFLPGDDDGISPHLPYGNNTNSSFHFGERLISSEHLWRYLEDNGENSFFQFYEESGIAERLARDGIGLFGISIISPTQAIASLTLGLYIKKRFPCIHVTIGGQWVTLYRDAILEKKELFRCFDSMIVFEGESALYELARRLEIGEDVASIPNLVLKDTAIDVSFKRHEEDMDLLPSPDFDGLPLADYTGMKDRKISLTFETSRGCYWNKCAYCVDLPLPKPSYRRKSPALVARDMKELKDKYGAKYLLFGDPGLSSRQMREMSDSIIKERVKMEWWTMARLDAGFTRELFDLAYKAGLRQVNFGFESANDRVCKLLDKGNERARSSRIIRDCAEAGIKVDLQTMLALPGESFEDGLETIDFLISNKKYIYDVTFNTYYLTPFNYVHMHPEKYGIDYRKDADLPFRFFIPFNNTRGMSASEAELLKKIYYTFMNKGEIAAPESEAEPASNECEEYVEFGLNGESCRLLR